MVTISSDIKSVNSVNINLNGVMLYFSYETLIGFRVKGKLYLTENCWGSTTGKHLNRIADKSQRMSYKMFDEAVKNVLIPRLDL